MKVLKKLQFLKVWKIEMFETLNILENKNLKKKWKILKN